MIQPKDIVFIFNPHSGKRKSTDLIEELLAIDPEANYFVSRSLTEFDAFFRTEVHRYKVVVICGGDGTINTTLKYLIGKEIALAVLPNGSGNGFARELGFKNDIRFLIDQILLGNATEVDLIQVNDELSCNVTGLGFDSYVTTAFDKGKYRGFNGYVYNSIRSLFTYKPIEAELTFENTTLVGKFLMICIANTRQFGSGAFIAPEANYHDGLLEIVLIRPIPFYHLPAVGYRLFTGMLAKSKYIEFIRSKSISIKSNSHSYHVDGEPKILQGVLHASITGKIKVVKMAH